MEYNKIKLLVDKLIKDELGTTYVLPALTNFYIHEKSFRLFYVIDKTSFMIDIEIDGNSHHSNLMIFGAQDFGPFDLTEKNIKRGIKHIKKCINSQFTIEYFDDRERIGEIIFLSRKALTDQELNQWLRKRIDEDYFLGIATKAHPKGHTRIKYICTQYTFKGHKQMYKKVSDQFIKD